MFRKIISLLVSVSILIGCIPALSFADTETYSVNITLMPESSADEEEFRKKVADLITRYKYYYTEYLFSGTYDYNNERSYKGWMQNEYQFYYLDWGQWKLENSSKALCIADNALYHPYYLLADKKQEFNGKVNKADIKGNQLKTVEYTLLSEEEQKEMYIWIIKETLKEKLAANPSSFTEIKGNRRYYVFNVSTGQMEQDAILKDLDEKTWKNMWQDAWNLAIDLIEVTFRTYLAYNSIASDATGKIMDEAKAEASGKKDRLKEFMEKVTDKIVDEAIECVSDSMHDIVEINRDQINAELRNAMKNALAAELATSMSTANSNMVEYLKEYLKTTYLSEASSSFYKYIENTDSAFIEAVQSVVSTLETKDFPNRSLGRVRDGFNREDEQISNIMEANGLTADHVMNTKEFYEVVGKSVGSNLLETANSILKEIIKEAINQLNDSLTDNRRPTAIRNLVTSFTSAGDKLAEEFIDRFMSIFNEQLNEAVKDISKASENGKSFDELWAIQFDGKEGKKESYDEYFGKVLRELAVEIIADSVTFSKSQKEYDNAERFKKYGLEAETPPISNSDTIIALVSFAISCTAKNAIIELKQMSQSENVSGQIKSKISELDKSCDRIMNDSLKLLKNKNAENIASFFEDAINLVVDVNNVSDSLSKSGLQAKKIDAGSFAGYYSLDIMKSYISSDELMDIIFSMIFEGSTSAEDVARSNAKKIMEEEENSIGRFSWLDDSVLKRARARVYEVLEEGREKVEKECTVLIGDAVDIVSEIWDSMIDCSESLATLCNSIGSQATGTHLQSLDAERVNQTKLKSKKLEDELITILRGGRIEMERDADTYDSYLRKCTDPLYRYLMNEKDVVARATKPEAQGQYIVPLQDVIVVARKIMTQIHLDAVGMGAYLTLVINRDEFKDTEFSKEYIQEHILLEEGETKRRYNQIVDTINDYTPPFDLVA